MPGYRQNVKTIILKEFLSITIAKIYEARLNEAGVKTFLSNTNTGQLIPVQNNGIIMHILEDDLALASEIVAQLDTDAVEPFDEDYREADMDDIEFAKSMKENEETLNNAKPNIVFIVILILVATILILSKIF